MVHKAGLLARLTKKGRNILHQNALYLNLNHFSWKILK